jgi:hypothetical protein
VSATPTANEGVTSGGQVDVNQVVKDRLARQAKQFDAKRSEIASQAVDDFVADLGISPDEVDSLKDLIAAGRERESEAKRSKREADTYKKRYEEASQKLAEHDARERKRTITKAIEAAAGDGAHRRSVVAEMVLVGGLDIDSQGQVTAHGEPVAKAVKQLLADNPHLVRASTPHGGGGSRGEHNPPNSAGPDLDRDPVARNEFLRKHLFGPMMGGGNKG